MASDYNEVRVRELEERVYALESVLWELVNQPFPNGTPALQQTLEKLLRRHKVG